MGNCCLGVAQCNAGVQAGQALLSRVSKGQDTWQGSALRSQVAQWLMACRGQILESREALSPRTLSPGTSSCRAGEHMS